MATICKRETGSGTSYQAKVRLLGEKPRSKTFARLTDAKAWAASVETDLGRGVHVPTTAERKRTLGGLIEAAITDYLPAKKKTRDNKSLIVKLTWWKAELGHIGIDRLQPEHIDASIAKLRSRDKRPLTPATCNRFLAALSGVCRYGIKLRWLKSNPVAAAQKGTESAGVVRFLTDDERRRLLDAAKADSDPNMHTAIVLALATGARCDNLRRLTWADIDFERRAARFDRTKSGDGRWIPLIPSAVDALTAHKARDPQGVDAGTYVFKDVRAGCAAGLNTKPWRRVRDAAALDSHMRFHDLRHTTATYLLAAGANTIEIAAALGHKTLAMAQRYAHQSPDMQRAVFDKLAGKL